MKLWPFKKFWRKEQPPPQPTGTVCGTCGTKPAAYRRYADGRVECIPCAEERR